MSTGQSVPAFGVPEYYVRWRVWHLTQAVPHEKVTVLLGRLTSRVHILEVNDPGHRLRAREGAARA